MYIIGDIPENWRVGFKLLESHAKKGLARFITESSSTWPNMYILFVGCKKWNTMSIYIVQVCVC